MRHAQKLIALLLAVALICGVCLAVTDTTVQDTGTADASATAQLLTLSTVFTFSDVPADVWYADAVAYASSAGIMGGTTAANFSPDEIMTRAMLIVTPSFYPAESADSSIPTAAGSVKQFPRELVNDLIPAVEGTYPTYAKTTETTGLQSSRDHRGFGGFSMGSVATWYVFTDCLDYFRYYLPLSGDSWIFGQYGGSSNPEGTAAALSQALENSGYGQNDFFIHAMTGTSDIAYTALSPQIAAMQETTDFIFDQDTSVGNFYFTVQKGGTHDYAHIYGYLYNALPVFWGG